MGNNGCICQKCGEYYTVDILIPNEIWMQIKPSKGTNGLLCGACIMKTIENTFKFESLHLFKEATIRTRFHYIINGKGLVVPRQMVGYAINDLLGGG